MRFTIEGIFKERINKHSKSFWVMSAFVIITLGRLLLIFFTPLVEKSSQVTASNRQHVGFLNIERNEILGRIF